ncbi:putative Transposase-associated domain-containing protein [Helianthus annuus]|nr:putative Transposase-associated domain-containing protein [Helianthus annuus]
MDKSWMLTDRTKKPYMDGVAAFLDYAVRNLKMSTNIDPKKTKQKTKIPCPCINCLNHYSLPLDEVDHHLFNKGIDPNYTRWIKHGEKDEPVKNVLHTEYFDTEIPTDATETIEMVNATEDNFTEDYEKLQELLVDAEKPLYKGCPNFTKLSALVQLVNLKSKHGVSDKCFTELLVLLKKMLPEGNEMSICSKEIKVEELDKLQEELCVTLCLLEKYFPPSFFDIMIHLTVHLTREVKLCGPICFRWMYPFERCMKVIKGHVRNKTYPEGCIAEENIAEETIEFFSEYQKKHEDYWHSTI